MKFVIFFSVYLIAKAFNPGLAPSIWFWIVSIILIGSTEGGINILKSGDKKQ